MSIVDNLHMTDTIIRVQLDEGASAPVRAHAEDAGMDIHSLYDVTIPAHGSAVVHTGVHVEIARGWYGKLESKSGLNVNHGVFCTGGVIDAGFTGAITLRLANVSDEDYEMHAGDKCVQMVLMECCCATPIVTDTIEAFGTRGDDGWGSTGR